MDSLRVTVMQMKNVLGISNVDLIIVLTSSLLLLIAVLQPRGYLLLPSKLFALPKSASLRLLK